MASSWWERAKETLESYRDTRDARNARYEAARAKTPEENEADKAAALRKCHVQHEQLLACYRDSLLPVCLAEYKAFWSCFRAERGFARISLTPKTSSSSSHQSSSHQSSSPSPPPPNNEQ